jgi:hypothetical protein
LVQSWIHITCGLFRKKKWKEIFQDTKIFKLTDIITIHIEWAKINDEKSVFAFCFSFFNQALIPSFFLVIKEPVCFDFKKARSGARSCLKYYGKKFKKAVCVSSNISQFE